MRLAFVLLVAGLLTNTVNDTELAHCTCGAFLATIEVLVITKLMEANPYVRFIKIGT